MFSIFCSSSSALSAAGVGLVSGAGYFLKRHNEAIRVHVFSGQRQSQVRQVVASSARSLSVLHWKMTVLAGSLPVKQHGHSFPPRISP